ncbi:putative LRR receptor-like serine/threonine-protein kinase [Acorus calamus]|uniref:non-specific serine/threonine protein kinase n=1 Tax=Acorus calamus TaxID=4465 RepID=A0AAV9C9Z7_ACOCL|nr:putative LRR receptor-like serine/threonine-protein kinase [Acorus calamus]
MGRVFVAQWRLWKSPTVLLLLALICIGGGGFRSDSQSLPPEEVNALQKIGSKLKAHWNFSLNPCEWKKLTLNNDIHFANNVTCNCTFNNSTVCHITSIKLNSLNLTGELPEEFANLTFLNTLSLLRNYINGSIPSLWASLPLTSLNLVGNRIGGRIPKEIGKITTLTELVLDDNLLEGPLPPELGNLINLQRLLLAANMFTGEIPATFSKLKNLNDFRIDGNSVNGTIPDFISNWMQLGRLDIQGTSMVGPIPSSISSLTNLYNLRISDLKGSSQSFPSLQNMSKMTELVLRNCMLIGEIPRYLASMPKLNILDLSYNNLSGEVPDNLVGLTSLDMFLTNNMLTGSIPSWILSSNQQMDISKNNFSGLPPPSNCQQGRVNLAASYSPTASNLMKSCLMRNLPCFGKAQNYKMFINCGGRKVTIGEDVYDEDSIPTGGSDFIQSESGGWAYSSTGLFIATKQSNYVATNISTLNVTNTELYMTARLAPVSIDYYGFCLQNGNYTVRLHFAEIMFSNDQTYSSLGRRIFDVTIQGETVLKEFNIAEEAGGPGLVIIKNFTTLATDNTLDIHFYWAGKGTNAVPDRGVYGPLISAIAVTPNFKPDLFNTKLSIGAILGIVGASCVVIVLIVIVFWYFLRCRNHEDKELRSLYLQTGHFSLSQIKSATENFDSSNKIGEGGFGPVYKGILSNGVRIAVKQLSSMSKQGNREFMNEIGIISALEHPNLVKLFGCCIEGNQLLLVYEYMENNSLAHVLFGTQEQQLKLSWSTRRRICLGIARGLAYLHEESRLKIVHRDIKATNILLDKDLNAKISDFGLAKLKEEENTHISTRVAGTIGYMAPEYAMRGYLTDKADVYSFGVVMLEIVSGKSNNTFRPEESVHLLDWASLLKQRGSLLELVDQSLGSHYTKTEALNMLELAHICTKPSPTLRPTMSAVVSMLEGKQPVCAPPVPSSTDVNDWKLKVFDKLAHNSSQEHSTSESVSHNVSTDGPWYNSSVSMKSSNS